MLQTSIIYIEKSSNRVIRSCSKHSALPTGLKKYDVRFVSTQEKNYLRLQKTPYHFLFSYITGLSYQPLDNFNLEKINDTNHKLFLIEQLWEIGFNFIKNSINQYFYNEEIYNTIRYEQENNYSLNADSLINFISQYEEVDSQSHLNLINLKLDYVYNKRKDVVKTLLLSQEKILNSNDSEKVFSEELNAIYLKF